MFEAASKVVRFPATDVLSDPASVPARWEHASGRIDAVLISRQCPVYGDRRFSISGSPVFVRNMHIAPRDLGVKPNRIKTDYVPGLAS